jgi:hypothetical protein
MQTISGLGSDILADTARQVMRWSLPLEDTPEDALVYLLRDHGLPAYAEPYQQTLDRVRDFINVIPFAGSQSMLESQADLCGLTNSVVIPNLEDSEFSIAADNVGFMPRWGDPGLKWGDPIVWGNYVLPNTAKNLRSMLQYFRPARERYTGLSPTYWEPSLFAPYSWVEARHGTAAGGTFSTFADQGSIGGNHVPVASQPTEFDLLRSGSKLAIMASDEIQHNAASIFWRDLNGQTDGFFWWAGTLDEADVCQVLGTSDGGPTVVGFRVFWNAGALGIRFGDGSAIILDKSDSGYSTGYYIITVSIDTSQGTYGGVVVTVNGVTVAALGGDFTAVPSNANPQISLIIGANSAGGAGLDGDWQSFGWVRGRPAILPDITLLLNYFKAEVGNDWDPQDESIVAIDINAQDPDAFSFSSGNNINRYLEPEEGVSFTPPGTEPTLEANEFTGGQSGIRVAVASLTNTGDCSAYGDLKESTWLWVARNDTGSTDDSLLGQSGNFILYERTFSLGDGNYGYHDGSGLRELSVGPPDAISYAAGLVLNESAGSGIINASGFEQSSLPYDATLTFDNTLMTLFGSMTNSVVGRLVGFSGTQTVEWLKQRVLALQVQYVLPTVAS